MNPNKANGWILNPSKSYPGKFYYFNVLTGESAWTSGPEKSVPKSSDIHKISDKRYYPREPTSPPPDYPSTSTEPPIINQPKFIRRPELPSSDNSLSQYPSPMFGKALFPNYVSNIQPFMPNIVWAPVPFQSVPYVCKPTDTGDMNMTTQKSVINRVHVDACQTPLSKRFTEYNSAQKQNRFFETSTPIKHRNEASSSGTLSDRFYRGSGTKTVCNKSLNNNLSFKKVQTKSESDKSTMTLPEFFHSKSLESILDVPDQSFNNFKTKFVLGKMVEKGGSITNKPYTSAFDLNNLDFDHAQGKREKPYDDGDDATDLYEGVPKLAENDLRLLLITKRRKSIDMGEMQTSKKIKPLKEKLNKSETPKKHVSFHLDDSDTSDHQNDEKMEHDDSLNLCKDLWYVMADPGTLVDKYQLIEEYVLSDKSCRLLLPICLRSAIEAMGMGDCRGRQRVIVARQSARKLAQPQSYIVTMPEIYISSDETDISELLKYCLKIIRYGYKLVFLSDSPKLISDAKTLKIPCLTTKEIKSKNLHTPPNITFDLKKVKISCNNECSGETVYLPSSKFNKVLNNKEHNPGTITRRNDPISDNNAELTKADANTSPVGSDRLINITRKTKIVKSNNDLKKVKISYKNECSGETVNRPSSKFHKVLNNKEHNPETITKRNDPISDNNAEVTKADANTSPIGSDRLINITRKTKISKSKDKELEDYEKTTAKMGLDIQNLFLHDFDQISNPKKGKSEFQFQKPKIAGQILTKNVAIEKNKFQFIKPKIASQIDTKTVSIEKEDSKKYEPKKFDVKNATMKETIRTRFDELMCSLSQIVEDALMQVLMRHKKFNDNMIPPWVLYDVVDGIKKLYESHTEVKCMADKFTTMLLKQCVKIGVLNPSMAPTDFMQLFECAFQLIQALKAIQPTYSELLDAENNLNNLHNYIENPTNVILPITPPSSSSDITIESRKQNFAKRSSEIIDYLKKHFESWKNYDSQSAEKDRSTQPDQNKNSGDLKIVRTFGRNLRLLNIDGKSLTVKIHTQSKPQNTIKITKDNVNSSKDIPKNLNVTNDETCFSQKKEINEEIKCDPVSKITKQESQNMAAQPSSGNNEPNKENKKDELGTKTLNRTKMDLDALDYSEIKENDTDSIVPDDSEKFDNDFSFSDAKSFVYEIKKKTVKSDSPINKIKSGININNRDSASNIIVTSDASLDKFNSLNVKDDSMNDSGFENESSHAHSLVKTFLFELSFSFKLIHMFIDNCIKDFKEDRIHEENKLRLYDKASVFVKIVAEIRAKLKRIIERESNDSKTLQVILLRAGVEATSDKRITRYRQVVTKCLEQAVTLENALKIMLSLTGGDSDGSLSTCTLETDIRYFNIFA